MIERITAIRDAPPEELTPDEVLRRCQEMLAIIQQHPALAQRLRKKPNERWLDIYGRLIFRASGITPEEMAEQVWEVFDRKLLGIK